MKKRECRRIAQKIADLEKTIENSTDSIEIQKAKNKIMKICGSFTDIEAMMQIDEAVQEILKNSWLYKKFLV